jgi:hypothetical protein
VNAEEARRLGEESDAESWRELEVTMALLGAGFVSEPQQFRPLWFRRLGLVPVLAAAVLAVVAFVAMPVIGVVFR